MFEGVRYNRKAVRVAVKQEFKKIYLRQPQASSKQGVKDRKSN